MGRRTRAPRRAERRIPGAVLAAVVLLAGVAIVLSACSNSGLALARQACAHVHKSIALYTESEHDPDVAKARNQVAEADDQLEQALPLAAAANSADPTWNPLMTTLQELGHTREGNLVQALTAQCAAAGSSTTGHAHNLSPATGRTAGTGRTVTRPST